MKIYILIIAFAFWGSKEAYAQTFDFETDSTSVLLTAAVKAHMSGQFEEAGKIYGEILGTADPNSQEYIKTLHNLVIYYLDTKRYDLAEIAGTGMQKAYKAIYGVDHVKYASILSCLGTLYSLTGKFEDAEHSHITALNIYKKEYGVLSIQYMKEAHRLANLFCATKRYEMAEVYLLSVLTFYESFYGKYAQECVTIHAGLVLCYTSLGNEKQAEYHMQCEIQLLEHMIKNLKDEQLIKNLKALIAQLKTIDNKGLSSKSDDIILNRNQKSDTANYLLDLSLEYSFKNDYHKSDSLLKEVFKHKSSKELSQNPRYLFVITNVGTVALNHQKYERAKSLFQEGIKLIEKLYGKDNPLAIQTLYFLTMIDLVTNNKDNLPQTGAYLSQMLEVLKIEIENKFDYLTEIDRELFWKRTTIYLNPYHTFSYLAKENDTTFVGLSYDSELLTKALLLNSSKRVQQSILNSEDEKLISEWEKLKALKSKLISLESKPIEQNDEREKLKKEIWEIEKLNMVKSLPYEIFNNELRTSWRDLQKVLTDDEIAIEFIHLDRRDSANNIAYCALVLRSDYNYPKIVKLCDEADLKEAIERSPFDLKEAYSLIWKRLETHLIGVKNIYIAPTRLLHTVSFAGIKKDEGEGYLGDDFVIHNLLSTKDIITIKSGGVKLAKASKAVLFGGADYSLDFAELSKIDVKTEDESHTDLMRSMFAEFDITQGQGFTYLPGSRKEVQIIGKQLEELGWNTSVFIDKDATESHFKTFSTTQSPQLIHISTHGFYFPPSDKSKKSTNSMAYRISDNPLMRTGLVFSGANHIWSGKDNPTDNEDAILTAYEISNLNLSNTDLVVLSACNTGLGDIIDSEGVYGLQRAFRLAGAKSMVVSLWEVSDKETVDFMNEFYTNWTKGIRLKDALTMAQRKLQKIHPNNPEKWAGFILIE